MESGREWQRITIDGDDSLRGWKKFSHIHHPAKNEGEEEIMKCCCNPPCSVRGWSPGLSSGGGSCSDEIHECRP